MTDPCPHCAVKHRSITADQCLDRSMSEKTLQSRVMGRAKRRGWTIAHAGKGWVGGSDDEKGSWITPMSPGWPDLTLAKAGHRLLFFEFKREQGEVEPEQEVWTRFGAKLIDHLYSLPPDKLTVLAFERQPLGRFSCLAAYPSSLR